MEIKIAKTVGGSKTTVTIFGDGPICVDYKWEFELTVAGGTKKEAIDRVLGGLADFTKMIEKAKAELLSI